MKIFSGLKGYLYTRRTEYMPMSLYWRWLRAKWRYDLSILGTALLNPHTMLMLIVFGILCALQVVIEIVTDFWEKLLEKTPGVSIFNALRAEKDMKACVDEASKIRHENSPDGKRLKETLEKLKAKDV